MLIPFLATLLNFSDEAHSSNWSKLSGSHLFLLGKIVDISENVESFRFNFGAGIIELLRFDQLHCMISMDFSGFDMSAGGKE